MAIRIYKPTSPGRRNASVNLYSEVTKKSPEKTLLRKLTKTGGRNHKGVITTQHRGGGHKRRYRVIDFKRNERLDQPAKVVGVEYDPNRSANIALLQYPDGAKAYIIAPIGLSDGMTVINGSAAVEAATGNCMKLRHIPAGLNVHCIEMTPGRGAQMCRAAGTYARLTNKEAGWATLVMPSGEIRQVSLECRATIGQVGNTDHQNVVLGKAGRARWLGRRPHVRGVAMSHHAHPLGGGEGRSKGNRPPTSASGVEAKGGRTRHPRKASNKRIIRGRRSKRYGLRKF